MTIRDWKDEKDGRLMTESEIILGRFRLSVHHYVGCGEAWFMSCPNIFSRVRLNDAVTIQDAKVIAKSKLQTILESALKDITLGGL